MSPNAGGGLWTEVSANDYSSTHGAQINFADLTLFVTYAFSPIAALVVVNCALFVQTVCSLATVQGKSFLHLQTMGRDRGGGAQLST